MFGHDLRLLVPAALRQTYLNTATLGPVPTPAAQAAWTAEVEWEEMGPGHLPYYMQAREKARGFARRIEAAMPRGHVALLENGSEGLMRILWGISWHAGDEVITSDHEYPRTWLALGALTRRFGVKIHVLQVDGRCTLQDQLEQRLSSRTKLVVLSHVSHLTGWQLPVGTIAAIVHHWPDARVLIDGSQALGNICVNPFRTGADYYIFCGHKWMMAPPGWAGLWVRSGRLGELATVWPSPDGAFDPRDLDQGVWPLTLDSGQGLEYGSRDWPRVVGWSVTWDYFEEEGFSSQAVYQSGLAAIVSREIAHLPRIMVAHSTHPDYRPTAMLTLISERLGENLTQVLWDHDIVVRPVRQYAGSRISFGLFNTADDVDRLIEVLRGYA